MIAAGVTLFAELIFTMVTAAMELAIVILAASIRPWRYILSPSFRRAINEEYAQRGKWQKWFALGWGTAALITGIALIAVAAWTVLAWRESTASADKQHKLESAQHAIGAIAAEIGKKREEK
jgi:hypothetical protein